ncbi:MAG TPA: ABC transporter permease [Gemmatimonadales bacterium]
MSGLLYDVRDAFRAVRRAPGFTLVATLTLAVGIGANTAIFGMLDRLLLRGMPVEAPERLVRVVTDRGEDGINHNLSYRTYTDLRAQRSAFAGVLASTSIQLGMGGSDGSTRVVGEAVSGDYFDVLGIRPAAGRWFSPDEDRVGTPEAVVVLSHSFWTRGFDTDPGIVGRTIRLNDRPFTVVGVAPEGFTGLTRGASADLWIPLPASALVTDLGEYITRETTTWLDVLARLAPGLSRDRAQAALAVWDGARSREGLLPDGQATRLLDGREGLTIRADAVERSFTVLMGAVGVLLLIACANVAGLLLIRATGRRREFAVRLALGAGRRRMIRQLFTESLVLAALGGALGILVALWATGLLGAYRTPGGEAITLATGLDRRVLAFATLVSLATAVLFGLFPAFRASRPDLLPALKDAPLRARHRVDLRDLLVVGQVALSVVLLVGAALLVRTVRNLESLPVGFDPRGVLLAGMDLEASHYDRERGMAFYDGLLDRMRTLPGVEAATLATTVWPNPGGSNWSGLRLEGFTGSEDDVSFDVNRVGPRYFETLRVPLLRGRGFDARDRGTLSVAVVNETMARRYWPDQDPVGRKIYLDSTRYVEIVGVANDGKYRELREAPQATVFFPILQGPQPHATLLVRVAGNPLAQAPAVRRTIAALDPNVPVFDLRSLESYVGFARSREQLAASVVGLFSLVALGLAALGLYGVLAAGVEQRTREIGVRVALGAGPGMVTGLFLRRAALLVAVGLALGALGALGATGIARDLLFGVTPTDPASFLVVAAVLAAAAAAAAFFPVRRAVRLDPVEALRHE